MTPVTDPRVDAYIERAEPFARPILRRIRALVHEAEPGIEETLKWGFPHFMKEGIICSMAAFSAHCALGFWKGELVLGESDLPLDDAMGQFGRIARVEDLPERDRLVAWVRKAVALNEAGVQAPRPGAKRVERTEVPMPPAFRRALDDAPKVRESFEAMSPSQQREYVEWIADAKRESTRERRIATALKWIGQGKSRNWKYQKG
jgi:uncharacterized protein YdeI (YjbR/CyaY-like superfamily)